MSSTPTPTPPRVTNDGQDPDHAFFMNLLFYWVAALPILVVALIWLYFWRERQFVKNMGRRMPMGLSSLDSVQVSGAACSSCVSGGGNFDQPPPYTIYQSFPPVHKNKNESGDVIEVTSVLPPPSYRDAVQVEVQISNSRS